MRLIGLNSIPSFWKAKILYSFRHFLGPVQHSLGINHDVNVSRFKSFFVHKFCLLQKTRCIALQFIPFHDVFRNQLRYMAGTKEIGRGSVLFVLRESVLIWGR